MKLTINAHNPGPIKAGVHKGNEHTDHSAPSLEDAPGSLQKNTPFYAVKTKISYNNTGSHEEAATRLEN